MKVSMLNIEFPAELLIILLPKPLESKFIFSIYEIGEFWSEEKT